MNFLPDSLMFSRDSEKLGTEKVGTFFIAVDEKAPTVAFILLGVLTLLFEESVKGSTVLFNFKILPGVGGILSEANFRFFAEFEICKRCLGTGGFCMLFALSAYLKVFIVSDKSASVGLTQAIMQV